MNKTLYKNNNSNSIQIVAFFLFAIFVMLFELTFGQGDKKMNRWFNEAKQQFNKQSFQTAINTCNRILLRDSTFIDARLLLADIYHATDSVEQEIIQLEKASEKTNVPQVLYRLGDAYYSTGNYQKAVENFKEYLTTSQIQEKRREDINRKLKNCWFAMEAINSPVEFHPHRLPDNINTKSDEYWPNLSIDQKELIFTRLIKEPGFKPQEDFFVSEFDSAGWGKAQPIIEINTPENEGAQVVASDGKLLFFTACNRNRGWGSCDIYYSRFISGGWTMPRNAGGIVNSNYWEAQPAFSSDDRYLYFSSNRPGGFGNKDIWRIELMGFGKDGNPKWGDPKNLGTNINTKGNEISPFIHPNNKNFYFASDLLTGMGGKDVYMSEIQDDSIFSEPINLGYPVNTFNDEQGLFISADGKTGLFASARNKETGLDIYSFKLDEKLQPEPVTYLNAKVVDAKTQKPIQAQLELAHLAQKEITTREKTTDKNGEVLLVLPIGDIYGFSVQKEGYLFFSESFALKDINSYHDPYDLVIELKPIEVGAEMHLYNVYFKTDSFSILRESEPELQNLVGFLRSNPDLKVEVQGHTDDTGTAENNQILSELRSQSVTKYLIQHGIDKERLASTGFGETKPVASNETDVGRRLNRRTTIKILNQN